MRVMKINMRKQFKGEGEEEEEVGEEKDEEEEITNGKGK